MLRRGFMLAAAGALVTPARAARPTAVLELFTSQGCSSCPPADALLGELVHQPGVIALAWHVDYWNYLGWRDRFATPFATARQQAYAAQLHDEVYTPGLVVNGAAIVVGSDRPAVTAALAEAPPLPVDATLRRDAGAVVATVSAAAVPLSALFAVYEPQHVTAVGAGENGGRQLREYHIVTATQRADVAVGTAQSLRFPPISPGQGGALLLQTADLRVVGAVELMAGGSYG
jgi:hypothetical protein